MKNFLKHLYVTLINRYGSSMWFGIHIGVTQVDWHWVLETLFCVLINLMIFHTIYLEWKSK